MLRAIQFRRLIVELLFGLLILTPIVGWTGNLKVLVVLSDNSAPYSSFAETLNKNLPPFMESSVIPHPEQLPLKATGDLIVAVGMKATALAMMQTGIPVLAVMVPRRAYEEWLANTYPQKITRPMAAIYLDQPRSRQIDFWRALLPDRRKAGLLYSADMHLDIAGLRQDIARHGGMLMAQPVYSAEELFPHLEEVLTHSDVLLAVPDSAIYNSSNIRNILLTSYRHAVPLVGLSEAYVKAGALGAIFSTPRQLAEQTQASIKLFAETRRLPDSQYPAAYTIAINRQVAISLGIAVPSEQTIRSRMEKAEEVR